MISEQEVLGLNPVSTLPLIFFKFSCIEPHLIRVSHMKDKSQKMVL